MTLKSDAKFEEKLTLGSKNDKRNLVIFNESSQSELFMRPSVGRCPLL